LSYQASSQALACASDPGSGAKALTGAAKVSGIQHGLLKVAEVIFGCVVGSLVTLAMSKISPPKAAPSAQPLPVVQDAPPG